MSMNSAAPQKFSFDLDLDHANRKSRLIGQGELADMLRKAEEKAYANGFRDGENSAANRNAAQLAEAAGNLARRTIEIARKADESQKQTLADAAALGVATGRKLAANLIARHPLGEIRSLITECLSTLENVPHLVIRCHPDLAGAIEEETTRIMQSSGFDGRLVIMGEPEILLGDARLEWVDGGLVRDLSRISEQIDRHLKAFIDARGPNMAAREASNPLENENEQ